jgi:hypothetical protein
MKNIMQASMESYQEQYGWYGIQVFVRPLEDGTFNAHGWIRHVIKNPMVLNDLPYECPFDTYGQRHPTEDAALRAGIGFARKKIDGVN